MSDISFDVLRDQLAAVDMQLEQLSRWASIFAPAGSIYRLTRRNGAVYFFDTLQAVVDFLGRPQHRIREGRYG